MAEDQEKAVDESAEAPKKSKTMLFVIIGFAVLVMGGGGFFAYSKLMIPNPPANVEGADVPPPKNDTDIIGEILPLSPFTVNLSDPKGKRYLKVQIELELEDEKAVEAATRATPKMRDMVIMMLTSLTFEDVMTPEGKIRIRDELLERFNQIMRPIKVKNIYITDFVVQ